MRHRSRSARLASALVHALSALSLAASAFAQAPPAPKPGSPPSPGAPPPAAPPAPGAPPAAGERNEANKAEAEEHFRKGLTLFAEQAWAAALAEFQLSRSLYPTRAATNNAAISLRKLARFDEALDMFETLLREFPTMADADKTAAQTAVAELRGLVGTIEIEGAEVGAAISVDGQSRAEFPLVSPLRVSAGSHVVRVFKEGFEAFERRVDVAGGKTARVVAKLRRLTQSGRLKVAEQTGRVIDVVVDNVVVGKTPWEGTLSVGRHVVFLRGPGKLGTQPALAPVKSDDITALALIAEELDSSLRVDPKPPGATVSLDGVPVGRGSYIGRLRSGSHRVEVSLEGYLPLNQAFTLAPGAREILNIELKRDPRADVWRKPGKWAMELDAGLVFAPSLGGVLATGCTGECSRGIGFGALGFLSVGYELGSGIGFGVQGGGLTLGQSAEKRAGTVQPNGLEPVPSLLEDEVDLKGAMVGATVWARFGEQVPVTLRFGAGVLFGKLRDERRATFEGRVDEQGQTDSFTTYPVAVTSKASYVYLDPEVRVGYRLGKRFEVGAAVKLFMLVATSKPAWDASLEFAAGDYGIATYAADPIAGDFILTAAPSLTARYEF